MKKIDLVTDADVANMKEEYRYLVDLPDAPDVNLLIVDSPHPPDSRERAALDIADYLEMYVKAIRSDPGNVHSAEILREYRKDSFWLRSLEVNLKFFKDFEGIDNDL